MTALFALLLTLALVGGIWWVREPDPAIQAAETEDEERRRGQLAALTVADIAYLAASGWDAPEAVKARLVAAQRSIQEAEERERFQEILRVRAERLSSGRATQADLAAEADARVQRGDRLPMDLVTGSRIVPGPVPPLDRTRPVEFVGKTYVDGVPHRMLKQDGHVYALPITNGYYKIISAL